MAESLFKMPEAIGTIMPATGENKSSPQATLTGLIRFQKAETSPVAGVTVRTSQWNTWQIENLNRL